MFNVNTVLEEHYPALKRHPLLFKSSGFVLRHLLHEREFAEFERLYPHLHDIDFVEQVLEYFSISCSARDVERENIPTSGKLLIIANHPISSLDALALIKVVSKVRSDLKAVANQMLMAIKPLNGMLLPVNNMQGGTPKQHLLNIQQHLQDEGVVLIFPAGEVSRLRPQGVRDTHWHSDFLRIAKAAQAPILPVFIDAKNSPLFYGASMLYKPLATALLVKEMFKQKRKHIPMRMGEVIPHSSYANIQLPLPDLAKIFKTHLYRVAGGKRLPLATQRPIAAPEDRKVLKSAIHNQCERLGETADGKQIFLYQHMGSSAIMREIGRLRELAFRAVGEGSLKRRDIDPFDSHYYHLLLWDENDLEIVGAYRLGDAALLSQPEHPTGLYSATLFDYGKGCNEMFEHGLELGRSFVQPRYWGKRSLDYLWFGIGAFLARYPRYRYMFGPVSISNAFPAAAIRLLVDYYANNYSQLATIPELSAQGKLPYPLVPSEDSTFSGLNSSEGFKRLKHLLANMGLNVPTLLKQYSELTTEKGVSFLDFNIDPEFNHCIDGFVVADMHMLKDKKYSRYIQPHLDKALAS